MARKPLIAGNWKMNLDHQQAIGTVQKLAFALPKEYFEKVDVAVTVPFTDIRSVQTLVEGAKPVTSAHDRQKAAPWALSFGPPQILPRCP